MAFRKASFNLPRNRNCLGTWSRKVLAHRFLQNLQSHSRRKEWPKRTTERSQSRKNEAMEEGAVRETPTAFCSLDYPWRDEAEVKSIVSKGKKAGKKPFQCTYGDQIPRRSNFSICPVRASRMVTSRHPCGPRIRILQGGGWGGWLANRKWFLSSVKSDLFLPVSYLRRV